MTRRNFPDIMSLLAWAFCSILVTDGPLGVALALPVARLFLQYKSNARACSRVVGLVSAFCGDSGEKCKTKKRFAGLAQTRLSSHALQMNEQSTSYPVEHKGPLANTVKQIKQMRFETKNENNSSLPIKTTIKRKLRLVYLTN